jgi:general secretion pathway protein K
VSADVADERGWALVSVLCVVSMLALMAAAAQELTLTSSRAERATSDAAEFDADIEAGFARALLGIADSRIESRWRVDGIQTPFTFDGARMLISVQDEAGRFDLNTVDGATLTHILQSAGLASDDAAALSDKIQDWRSANDFARLHGATDADYAARGYPWHPRHGPFQSIDELKLVMDMTPALFAKIRPALTIYAKRSTIDPEVAPRAALRALFFDDPSKADDLVQKREEAAARGAPVDTSNPDFAFNGRTYTATIDLYKYGKHRHDEITAMLTGDEQRPFMVLSYR